MDAFGGCHFDLASARDETEEPVGLDFSRMEHGRVRSQITAYQGECFVH